MKKPPPPNARRHILGFVTGPKQTTYAELLRHAPVWAESTTKHKEESRCVCVRAHVCRHY